MTPAASSPAPVPPTCSLRAPDAALLSAGMRRWLVPAALLAASVASGALALGGGASRAPDDEAAARPAAPVLSARRAPEILRRTIGDVRLTAGLDAALADPALGDARDDTCLIVRHRDRILYDRERAMPLLPASTLKILTAIAALDALGADGQLVTEVRAERAPRDGVVEGSLYLIGGGDALLSTTDYAASFKNQPQVFTSVERLADQLVAQGVRSITGSVVGDDSRYDAERYVPTWKPGYRSAAEVGPIGALIVNDGFAQWTPRKLAAANPAEHAAAVFTELLRARGVVVAGAARAGRLDNLGGSHLVSTLPSVPIRSMVGEMLRESDNTTAEVLTKELGRRAGEGTWTAGVGALRDAMAAEGLPVEGFAAVDGSGLDRSNRATCALLIAALVRSGATGAIADGLPVAGQTGTLATRFIGHPAAGRLRAKTGSLDGVAALSGFMPLTEDTAPLAFALLANEVPREAIGRALQERVAAVLASYPDAPSIDELSPVAASAGPVARPDSPQPEPAPAP